jgi:hypothetical protein
MMMETVFSVGSTPRLYNENPKPAGRIIEGVHSNGSRISSRGDGKELVDFQEFGRDRRLHVCCSYSGTDINPLPGYN